MQPLTDRKADQFLLYDASLKGVISFDWLDDGYWKENGTIKATDLGRGSAWFVSTTGKNYVLRHYRRGGWVSHISTDQYIWTGLQNTRAWREWTLLAQLSTYNLPAPIPVAARVIRSGIFYSADLLTIKLENTVSLSDYLKRQELEAINWQEIGRTIRRFHLHQVYHADLNAHNILLDNSNKISLIDFDKGYFRSGSRWYQANLKRLHKSLAKLASKNHSFHFSSKNWQQFLAGYDGDAAKQTN
jgi:3-deoxy-D-manno-octulosonic acid kinase